MKNVKSIVAKSKQFILWSAGVVPSILEKCPTEQGKYTAMGVILIAIAILASVSFSFFLSETFSIFPFVAFFGGMAWGFGLIFNLDRVLLTSFRKGDKNRFAIFQRFALTIALSLIISEPLLLYIFRNEIELELVSQSRSVVTDAKKELTNRYQTEIERLQKANDDIQSRLDALKTDRDNKEIAVIEETEGKSKTGKAGFGIAAKQKEAAFKEADAKYDEYKNEAVESLSRNNSRLTGIRGEIENETNRTAQAKGAAKGVLARHAALFEIIKTDLGAAFVYLPLFFGLLFLETLPMSLKVFGKKGVYDEMLEAEEAKQIAEIQAKIEFEKANLDRSRKLQSEILERLYEKIADGKLDEIADENERKTAQVLKTEVLQLTEQESIKRVAETISQEKFGEALIIEVIGNNEYEFTCEAPKNVQKTLTLETISGDFAKISEKIGKNLELVKAYSSTMKEISASLPLLSQIENDRKILLEFAPKGEC